MDKPVQKRFVLLAVIGAFLLFLLWAPGNHAEAEDAFEYSRQIEESFRKESFHPHHLIYIPSSKVVYRTAKALGYHGRSYHIARGISMVSGIIAVGLMYLLGRRLFPGDGSRSASYLTAAAMLFSYGFWRYSCETEIYIPALVLSLSGLVFVTHSHTSRYSWFGGVIFSSFSVLMHVLNVVPAILISALIYAQRKKEKKYAVLHVIAVISLVGLSYITVMFFWGFQPLPGGTVKDGGFSLLVIPRAIVGLGQSLFSANFIFSYDFVAIFLQEIFPYRVFAEELYLAEQISGPQRLFYTITFFIGLFSVAILTLRLAFMFFRGQRGYCERWIFLGWLVFGAVPVLWLEPSNPELWIFVLPPLWLLVGKLYASGNKVMPWGVIIILAVHNFFAGIGLVRNKEGDYNAAKAGWVMEHVASNDIVYTADSYVFSFYLNYWCHANVINLHGSTIQTEAEGNVFFLDDCYVVPVPLKVRWPKSSRDIEYAMSKLRPKPVKVYDDAFGGGWMLNDQ